MRLPSRFLLLATLLLVACGGSGSTATCEADYWDGVIGTCLPKGWQTLDAETLRQRGVPEETIVAFQRQEPVSGQFPTVAVTRETLAEDTDPALYSDANIRSVVVLEGYEQVDAKDFTVDGVTVKMHIFTAQPIEGEPRRRFYQVSTTAGDVGYTFTGVTPVSIDAAVEKEVMLMLDNMTFTESTRE